MEMLTDTIRNLFTGPQMRHHREVFIRHIPASQQGALSSACG